MNNKVPFGKRGVSSEMPEHMSSSNHAPGSGTILSRSVVVLLAGTGIILALTAFNMVGMKILGQRLHQQFGERVTPSSVISEEKMTGLKANVSETSQTIFATCGTEAKKQRLPREQADRIQHHIGILSGETALLRSASFLQCISGRNPQLYCQPGAKAFLVASITEYFGLRRQMAEEWNFAMRESGAYKILHSLPASKAEVDALNLPSKQVDQEVNAAITALASMGILSGSDFGGVLGFGTPKPISAALKDVEQVTSICSQQQ